MEHTLVIMVIGLILVPLWIMVGDIRKRKRDHGGPVHGDFLHGDPGTEHTGGVGPHDGWDGGDLGVGLGGDLGGF